MIEMDAQMVPEIGGEPKPGEEEDEEVEDMEEMMAKMEQEQN